MSSSKEALLSRLLQPESSVSNTGKSSLIQVVGEPDEVPSLPAATEPRANITEITPITPKAPEKKVEDEQPSILEMMMAAQREAKAEKEKEKSVEQATASVKPLGGGFKKGFFGGAAKPKAKSTTTTATTTSTTTTTTNATDKPALVEVKKATTSKSNPLVFEEVQKAMEEDTHPLLKQLQSNEWMTPDLVSNFQSNSVVSRGFANPKCMAAMQLLQKSPKEAQARYQNDPEVSLFLQEFAKLMAGHFEALGSSTTSGGSSNGGNGSSGGTSSAGSSGVTSNRVEEISMDVNKSTSTNNTATTINSTSTGGGIQEIGPLHAKVLQKKAQASTTPVSKDVVVSKPTTTKTNTNTTSGNNSNSSGGVSEEERVQQILQDEELRTLLMDPALQQILLECGDPQKFQQHMRNPDTYRKIVKLQQAGLVGTAR